VSNSIATTPTRRARRLRFSLRAGIATIAVFAVLFAMLDYWLLAPYRNEQKAAAALVGLGGKVLLVEHSQGWIGRHVGPDLFDTRVAAIVDLSHSQITDRDLVHLRAFHHVGQISLSDTEISNAGLEHLRGFVAGRFVDLSRTKITDVSSLFSNWRLDHPLGLKLSGNRIARGAFHFPEPKLGCQLQDLDLSETDASDQTLAELPDAMRSLFRLDLSGTNVTDAGLEHLLRFEELTTLGLSRTKVTPEGVARLKARWKGVGPLAITTGNARSPIIIYAEFPKK
jgi:hypothetical protein